LEKVRFSFILCFILFLFLFYVVLFLFLFLFLLLGHIINALDIAIQSMEKGETCQIVSTPKYAFGSLGCPPSVPANTAVSFLVELVDFEIQKKASSHIFVFAFKHN
jgi:hypothetical protein